jgi:hypothetical protein
MKNRLLILSGRITWIVAMMTGFSCAALDCIDSLGTPQILPFVTGDAAQWSASSSRTTGPDVLGWEREVVLIKTSMPSGTIEKPLTTCIGGGVMKVEGGEASTYTLFLLWDGVGEPTSIGTNDFALNIELSASRSGLSNLCFQFVAGVSVPKSVRLTIRLWNETNRCSEFTSDYLEAGPPQFHSVPLTSFHSNPDVGTPIQIKSIEVLMQTSRVGTQATLQNIGLQGFGLPNDPLKVPAAGPDSNSSWNGVVPANPLQDLLVHEAVAPLQKQ